MSENKLKILYLRQILLDEADEEHPINANRICEIMESKYECSYERRRVYEDIKSLEKFGMKIAKVKGSNFGYYVLERDFELPELKLLVDAVQSSKFITKEKSDELIRKLEKQTNKINASELQRNVFIYNRIKAENTFIYNNVDSLHAAIHANCQVSFIYCKWTISKTLTPRNDGKAIVVSPWALTWDDENYYLVAYDAVAGKIKHYRVDKMQDVKLVSEERLGQENFKDFDLAEYARKTFGMYGGPERTLTLEGTNYMVGVIIDRFGKDVMIIPSDENHFHASVTVSVSPQFFGWLSGLGQSVKITWPEDVRDEYLAFLKGIIENY